MRRRGHQALLLQAAQQAAHQAGIEAEIGADLTDLRPSRADGIQDTRRAEGPATAKERGIERTDLRSDGAGEATEASGCERVHNA